MWIPFLKLIKAVAANMSNRSYYCCTRLHFLLLSLVIPIRRSAATIAQPFPITSHNLAVKHTVACDPIGKDGMEPARVCVCFHVRVSKQRTER